MRTLLLSIFIFFSFHLEATAQDSVYYSVLWTPTHSYQRAGVKQEGVFWHSYKNGVLQDSFLLETKTYDSLGQLLRLDDYQRNKMRTRFQYHYSGRRLDSIVQEEIWLSAKIIHRHSYDDNGNLLGKQTFSRGRKTVQERYVYNNVNQLFQIYRQISDGPEMLVSEYKYRNDRLMQQIDYLYESSNAANNFSYIYAYANGNRTATKLFQRMGKEKRLIDCIRTYNEQMQLVEKINPPLPKTDWLPPDVYPRSEEFVETFVYHSNGMLAERQVRVNDKLVAVEKHVYVYNR